MTTTSTSSAASDRAGRRTIRVTLGGLMIGMFLASLDQMIMATSIRTIGDDLHGLSSQAWVTTAYLVTSTIATPLYGKLSDIYGRKPFYLLAISLFLVGSLLSGTAHSMYQLAAYRGVQGLGAGGLMSLAFTILGDLVPPRERARYQGLFLAVFGTSSVLGPVIGGFFAGATTILGITGWRWVFLINMPIGIIGLFVIWRVLHLPPVRRIQHRIDWPGALALVVGLVPLLVVAQQGRSWGWTSGRTLGCASTGAVGIVVLVLAERAAGRDALLPLALFRNRTFALGAAANTAVGLGMFGGLATLPLYLQIVQGLTPTAAGLSLIPLTAGIMVGSLTAGQLTARTGRYTIFPVLGTTLLTVASLLLARLTADTSMMTVSADMIVFGAGLGLTMQPLVLAVQNAVAIEDMGVGTSSCVFFRQVGGALGTAVLLSVLFTGLRARIADAFDPARSTVDLGAALADPSVRADPANRPVLDLLAGGPHAMASMLDDSSFLSRLDPRLARPFLVGFADSMRPVSLLIVVAMVVAIVLTALLPELPLRDVSGIRARQQADAAADVTGSDATGAVVTAPDVTGSGG